MSALTCANMRHQTQARCLDPVTSLDSKGYVYCRACASVRRNGACRMILWRLNELPIDAARRHAVERAARDGVRCNIWLVEVCGLGDGHGCAVRTDAEGDPPDSCGERELFAVVAPEAQAVRP